MAVLWPQRDNHWSLYGWMLLLLMLSMRLHLSLQVVCISYNIHVMLLARGPVKYLPTYILAGKFGGISTV